jgi:hypothetical protein
MAGYLWLGVLAAALVVVAALAVAVAWRRRRARDGTKGFVRDASPASGTMNVAASPPHSPTWQHGIPLIPETTAQSPLLDAPDFGAWADLEGSNLAGLLGPQPPPGTGPLDPKIEELLRSLKTDPKARADTFEIRSESPRTATGRSLGSEK